nr:MerR family transcriptional regulator [Rhizobium daejeonense]
MASLFGVTHRTLHFYEEKGLIKAGRVGLMRVYGRQDIYRMAVITACRDVGMPVAAIQDLMEALKKARSQAKADALFAEALLARQGELTANLSTIHHQMQQIARIMASDKVEGQSARLQQAQHIGLTDVERRCLELMAEGYASMRLARALNVSTGEISRIEGEIIRKFDASNRFQAVAKAVLLGLVN